MNEPRMGTTTTDDHLTAWLAAIDNALCNGSYMTGANIAFNHLCDYLTVERDDLGNYFDPQWNAPRQGEDEDDWYPGGWFGASWGAPVCHEDRHRETPVGWLCVDCVLPIGPDDQGMLVPYTYGAMNETSGRYEPAGTTLTAEHIVCFRRGLGIEPE